MCPVVTRWYTCLGFFSPQGCYILEIQRNMQNKYFVRSFLLIQKAKKESKTELKPSHCGYLDRGHLSKSRWQIMWKVRDSIIWDGRPLILLAESIRIIPLKMWLLLWVAVTVFWVGSSILSLAMVHFFFLLVTFILCRCNWACNVVSQYLSWICSVTRCYNVKFSSMSSAPSPCSLLLHLYICIERLFHFLVMFASEIQICFSRDTCLA